MSGADDISSVLVIGAGTMGTQIGLVFALSGYRTAVVDTAQEALDAADEQIGKRLRRMVEKDQRTQTEADAARESLQLSTRLEDMAPQADLVVEAAVEKLEVKRELFAQLDRLCPEHTILTTNSSTIGASRVAGATSRPDRVCNMHFFNPALVMKCVEVVENPAVSEQTIETVLEVARRLDKKPVHLHREIPGFVANRLMGAIRQEALRLEADGVASFEDIDIAARSALGHPMGPFELMDLVGIDVTYLIRMAEHEETGDDEALPHPSIVELYEAGRYGRKTGHGWYRYDD